MEDKFTNQEEQFRSLAEDFTLDIDTSELWDKVEAQLPPAQADRRRPIIWWFASGTIIATIGLILWIYNTEKIENQPTLNLNSSQIANIEKSTPTLNIKHIKNSPPSSNSTTPKIHPIKKSPNQKITKSPHHPINTSPHQHITTSPHHPITTSPHQHITTSPHHPINTSPHQKINTSKNQHIITSPKTIFNTNRYDEKPKSWKEEEIDQSPIVQTIDALINPSANQSIEEPSSDEVQKRGLITSVLLESKSLFLLEHALDFLLMPKQIKPLKVTQWVSYFSLTSGVNLHSTSIYSNTNDGLDLSQFENEKPLLGLNSDLRFGYENNKGWRFGFGLSHSRLVDRYTQQETEITTEEIEGSSTSKIDDEGNISLIDGSLSLTTITNHNFKWHRTHDFVDAQLNIGKHVFDKGNFTFYTDISISRNIWSRHAGYYFTKDNESPIQFLLEEESPYSSGGYSAGLSMDLEYKINAISICLRPFARFGLNSISQNSNYYQIKNSQYGIQLGVVYRP